MLPEDRFPRLHDLCDETVRAQAFATSLQVSVRVGGRSWDGVYGTNLGRPITPRHLSELHCLAKPFVAWTLLESASRHGVDPTASLVPLVPDLAPYCADVSIAQICNHRSGLAQPSALDWVTTPPPLRPGVAQLRPEPEGAWYSEVGAWIVAARAIEELEGRPAAAAVLALARRCGAELFLGPVPPGRPLLVPVSGLPGRPIPMLHVAHPTYHQRLGPCFGGFASMAGVIPFLTEVGRAVRGEPTVLDVSLEVLDTVLDGPEGVTTDRTWNRPAQFVAGFLSGATPSEPGDAGVLSMFAGIGSASCLLDPALDRQIAVCGDGASFDAEDHQFLRRQLLGAFLDDTSTASQLARTHG